MKKPLNLLSGVAMTVCVLFGTNAVAQSMSSGDFSASKTRIKTEYTSDKKGCDSLASNAKDICVAQAKGKEAVALAELCKQFELHPNQISEWKKQLLENAANVFGGGGEQADAVDLVPLHAKIGQQALELDFLNSALTKAGLLSAKP